MLTKKFKYFLLLKYKINLRKEENEMYSETKINVRYAETDQMGIVHHSVYAIWYEYARTEFSKEMGFPYRKMEEEGVMTPLVELHSKYIMPCGYDEEVVVRTKIGKLTPARVVFEYEVYKENKLINTGYTMHAITDKDLKPMNLKKIKPEIYQIMEKSMQDENKKL